MARFILKRILEGLLVLFVAISITFFLIRLSGDPTYLILPQNATQQDHVVLRAALGLDQPLLTQYGNYLKGAVHGDFGKSYFDQRRVQELIMEHLPETLLLAGTAILLAVVIAIPLGATSAVLRGSAIDRLGQALALGGYSLPSFWSAILLIQIFGVVLGWLPTFGSGTALHLILPAVNLAVYSSARLSRLTRSAMIEVLKEDYIRTARAKGVSGRLIVYKHALRNALLPIVTLLGIEMGVLLGGAVLTESVFAWPGVGWLVIRSVSRRDFPVVQGIVGYVALIFVMLTLVVDLTYQYINPKIRYS